MSSRMRAGALVGCVGLLAPADCWLLLRSRRRTPPRECFNERSDADCVATPPPPAPFCQTTAPFSAARESRYGTSHECRHLPSYGFYSKPPRAAFRRASHSKAAIAWRSGTDRRASAPIVPPPRYRHCWPNGSRQGVSAWGAPAQQPRLALPGCLRRAVEGETTGWTLISGGLAKGVRSP